MSEANSTGAIDDHERRNAGQSEAVMRSAFRIESDRHRDMPPGGEGAQFVRRVVALVAPDDDKFDVVPVLQLATRRDQVRQLRNAWHAGRREKIQDFDFSRLRSIEIAADGLQIEDRRGNILGSAKTTG